MFLEPAARTSAGPQARRPQAPPLLVPVRRQSGTAVWAAAARRRQVAAQATGRARVPKPERTQVTIRVPGEASMLFKRITQSDLSDILRLHGADGFVTDDGSLSRSLVDLPKSGKVDLFLPPKLPIEMQVRYLQSSADDATHGKEQQLLAFLQDAASKEHVGSPIVVLPTKPFKGLEQQDFLQLDAAVKVDDTLYVGEHKLVLGEGGVDDIEDKFVKIRAALKRNSSPDLAAALHGVTRVKLFLAGEAVRAGLAVDELANLAATVGASVVLPSGQALGLAAHPAPALQL